MILVCPSCDAKFKVPDGAIPAEGRAVRCAKCKNSWHASPQQILKKPVPQPTRTMTSGQGSAVPVAPSVHAAGSAEADNAPASTDDGAVLPGDDNAAASDASTSEADKDDFGIAAAAKEYLGDDFMDKPAGDPVEITEDKADTSADIDTETPDDYEYEEDGDYDEDDFLALRRADQRRQHERKAVGRLRRLLTIGWAALILFWLIVAYGFVFLEENMRSYLPGTSEFIYGIFEGGSDIEALKEKAGDNLTPSPAEAKEVISAMLYQGEGNPTGVSIEMIDGQQAIVVRGYIENKGTTGANVPVVLARILDANGRELDRFEVHPPGLILRRGGKLDFMGYHSPVPPTAATVAVDAVPGSKANRNQAP